MQNTATLPREGLADRSPAAAGPTRSQRRHAWHCFLAMAFSMLLNFFLSILNANGVGMNTSLVTIIQIVVTLACGSLLFSRHTRFRALPILALAALVAMLVIMNLIKTPNAKAFYDFMVIPLYIGLGASAVDVPQKWMSGLFWLVVAVVVFEVALPSVYTSMVNPGAFFMATREWVAAQGGNDALNDGLYVGAYRSHGSFFALSDHRVGGPFLEPLSLGYFAVLMTIYFMGFRDGKIFYRTMTVFACLLLSLLSDSRVASALIVISAIVLFFRPRLPSAAVWCTAPAVFLLGWIGFLTKPSFLVGDFGYRMALTFSPLGEIDVGRLLIGDVPTERMGDSGALYMIYNLGPIGFFLALWYYCGLITRSKNQSSSVFMLLSLFASTTLLFAGALFSIKTASLMGFLVGFGGKFHTTSNAK